MAGNAGLRQGDELAGKVALVTGGARNIGRAIARSLAAAGAAVMVNANTSREAALETVKMIENAGGKAASFIADVTDAGAVARMIDDTVRRFGRLDILVNNAAIRSETPFDKTTLEEWRRVLSTVLDGAFLCTQAGLPHLIRAGGGSVVNIGGLTGHKGALHRSHVVTAKGGLAAMTKALALDFAEHGITVNCVVPGTIEAAARPAGCAGTSRLPARRCRRWAGAANPRKSRRWCACCAAPMRATSPGNRSTSTAEA